MSRIAEFQCSDDALRFAKLKGEHYTVCGGIDMPWAVRVKETHEMSGGRDEPPVHVPRRSSDDADAGEYEPQ